MKRFNIQQVVYYHERTKHHYHRYARSSGRMDWANQPNPFRTYEGCPVILLPLLEHDPDADHGQLYRNTGNSPKGLTLNNVSGFLELSMGLSAWKTAAGSRWSLRINPSSGNLHPTEAHLLLPELEGAECGVYHYRPLDHALEQRARINADAWKAVVDPFGGKGFFIALSSIYWRESWKYGERAFRYCHLDAGHALAALRFSANLYGWQLTVLSGMSDRQLGLLFGFHKTHWRPQEEEHPDLVIFAREKSHPEVPLQIPPDAIEQIAGHVFKGTPEPLSAKPTAWEIIHQTAAASARPVTEGKRFPLQEKASDHFHQSRLSASKIIRNRRSATGYDRRGKMGEESFLAILEKTLPAADSAPFYPAIGPPCVHLALFVHRVAGMEPGLYCLVRNDASLTDFRTSCRRDFLWRRATDGFPLYLLEKADMKYRAMEVSCHQEIAGDGVFSLGMIAEFDKSLSEGAYRYRTLHWECGMIGQALYLESEAQGFRGTGIGCFFDDPMHALLGISDTAWQSLYHFTVGLPLEDPRLATLPPYGHRK